MELYSSNQTYKLFHGNMLDLGEVIESCSIDSVICDPPYELNFMGKGWDNSGIAFQPDTWEKCLKALKPGGYLLAFGGSRTYHRIACAIEDAGFEIRDCIMWLYGSGFPKSMNIGLAIDKKNGVESEIIGERSGAKNNADNSNASSFVKGKVGYKTNFIEKKATNEWQGWGTALKPSYEPIIVARKPLEGSCTDNVIKYGVGGINIDECRIGTDGEKLTRDLSVNNPSVKINNSINGQGSVNDIADKLGRFPANTVLTYDESDFEEVCGGFPDTKSRFEERNDKHDFKGNKDAFTYGYKKRIGSGFNDEGSAARYFYCAKASKRDRDEGLNREGEKVNDGRNTAIDNPFQRGETLRKNIHPTVKPTDLMQYLVRLVTPFGGTVLDPFNGSGSTGKAVMYENKDRNKNYKYIGIELTEEYLPIAKARIEYVINKGVEKEVEQELPTEQPTEQRKESALF